MAGFVPLPGSKRELLPNSRPAGPINPSEIAVSTVRVRSVGDIKALEKTVYELGSQKLKDRTYLTREELAQKYGASAEDLDLIEQLAQQHNLVVVHRSTAERSIVLQGRLGDLLDAFPADLGMYHHAVGTYRGRRGEIQIPSNLIRSLPAFLASIHAQSIGWGTTNGSLLQVDQVVIMVLLQPIMPNATIFQWNTRA